MDSEYLRGLEDAAKIAEFYAETRLEMAGDTVLLDPCLSGKGFTAENIAISEDLQMKGAFHSAAFHAGTHIAEAIRAKASRP